MARYAYDVNTTTRLIDVHKQFNGGLKTVDTDDSLGAVFLRQAENVSLSEFGFIEKRYGTFENFKAHTGLQDTDKLQGYWEFYPENTLYKIIAINGDFYVNGEKVTTFYEEKEEYRYPNLSAKFSWTKQDLEWTNVSFQPTKEIGSVIKDDVIYFFTGTYPVYAAEFEYQDEEGNDVIELRFYLLPIEIPTYDEIVVVGHNLLENDYEGLYYPENFKDLEAPAYDALIENAFEIGETDVKPLIPYYSPDGEIDLKLSYKYKFTDTFNYSAPITGIPGAGTIYDKYKQLRFDRVEFRTSGAGASLLDFQQFDPEYVVASNNIHNLASGENAPTLFTEGLLFNKRDLALSEFEDITAGGSDASYHHRYKFIITNTFSKDVVKPNDDFVFQIFKTTGNPNTPFEKVLISEFDNNPALDALPGQYATFGGEEFDVRKFFIKIKPRDINDAIFENGIITIEASSILTENDEYSFKIPSFLTTSDFVQSYDIEFTHPFVDDVIQVGAAFNYSRDDFKVSLGIRSEQKEYESVFDNNYLTLNLSNLVNGTFDIRPVYKYYSYNWNGTEFTLDEEYEVTKTFYNITITPEKLQDYSGSEGVPTKLEALWECNNVIEHFGKLMVWGSTKMPNSVFFSFPDRPSFFPSKFYLDFGSEASDPVTAITPYMNILVVQTLNTTWGVRGNSGYLDSPAPYVPFSINSTVGTIAPKSVRAVRNHLFFLSKIGIISLKSLYAADEQYNIEFVDRNIKNIVPQDPEAVGIQYDNQYWLNFPNFGITLRWYIDKKAWVLDSFGPYKNKITNSYVSKLGAWFQFNGILKWQIVNGNLEFITQPSAFIDGENLSVYKIGVDYSLPTDLGQNVFTKFETSFLNQNYPFHPKNYKELKLDFTLQNEYNSSNTLVYSMDEAEHISDDVHKIDNVSLLKNHKYRIVYNFSQHTTDEIVLDGGSFTEALSIEVNGSSFDDNSTAIIIGAFTFSLLNAQDLKIRSIRLTDKDDNEEILLENDGFRIIENPDTYDEYVEFLLPNSINGIVDIIVDGDFSVYNDGAVMFDITYDANLQIKNWVVSESATLNIEDFSVPDQSKVALDLDFDSSLGNWVFGSSDFGNKVTAVKTVKLSGKGYNAKLYLEDETKSKWTLESLGLTYKMKRARSR